MVRRALSRTVRLTPPEPERAARYLLLWNQGELYHHPEHFPRLTSAALFGNERPLALEIGCGTGEALVGLAAAEPDTNFLGVEPWTKVIYRAVNVAAEAEVANVRFIRARVEFLYPLLLPDSLHAVYIHYPDPNLRSRGQHKILNAELLDVLHEALLPDGLLHIVSDRDDLVAETVTLLADDDRWEHRHAAAVLLGYNPPVKSRYQRLWEKHAVPPKRMEVRKRRGLSAREADC